MNPGADDGRQSGIKREPRRYLYHLYLAFMDYHGLGRPLSVQGFARAVKAAAKEYGTQYSSRTIKGRARTNVTPTKRPSCSCPRQPMLGMNDASEGNGGCRVSSSAFTVSHYT